MRTYREQVARVSTALADPTRREIMEYVLHSGSPLSVRDVAEYFDLHANAARLHLEKLVKGGLLQVFRRRGASGGRPANLYGASDEDVELNLPPRNYRLLAEILAKGVKEGEKDIISRMGQEAFERGRLEAVAGSSPLACLPSHSCIGDTATAWLEEIERRGHKATRRQIDGDSVEVTFLTCPFGEFSRHHPGLACEIHRRLEEGCLSLAGALGLEAMDRDCTFILRADK